MNGQQWPVGDCRVWSADTEIVAARPRRLPTNSRHASEAAGMSDDAESGPSPLDRLPVGYAPIQAAQFDI